ncbi:MAG: hypothetical protein CHACPFDD_00207 [Phycisphaerae bacterium]|nr:hypothetical protein [Phycisphaerae bacterium]
MRPRQHREAFTLIELLVVVAIIALLVGLLMPALNGARQQARASTCLSNLRNVGQGLVMYTMAHGDVLVPGRLPEVDNCNWQATIVGGLKYRPTFLAMASLAIGVAPFEDPMDCKNKTDRFGEPGNKQNYSYGVYVCTAVPTWTDERNGSYGYNYQFLGNSRLDSSSAFKNWPVNITKIRHPGDTVAVGDSMGTAASHKPSDRQDYINNDSSNPARFGNEGFNLDPPHIASSNGEAAGYPDERTAVDPRHRGRGNVLFVDGHASGHTVEQLGYKLDSESKFTMDGDNSLWCGSRRDEPWTPQFLP